MENTEFKEFRQRLNKTQNQLAQLLGVSLKAVHSYEQGWRTIPPAVERQIYFLLSRKNSKANKGQPCWKTRKCDRDQKLQCPAWEFNAGDLCWFINGTICDGGVHNKWKDKMKICRSCEVFTRMF